MANKIILKKTSTASKVPLATDLEVGEIAVNLADQKLYSKNASGTVILVGDGQGTGDVVGPSSAVNNNFTAFNGTTGKLVKDSGYNSASFATAAQGALADTAVQSITSTDGSVTITGAGTTKDLSVAIAGSTTNVLCLVRNTTGSTLAKGTVVYISGATGQNPTVSKAIATSDATSAQTLGMMTADLANNSNGYVTIIGLITEIDTSAYTDGQQLYLSGTTAGAVTGTKPSAPIHLVYVAVVEYAHPVHGKLFVKVQNGYELNEIHDVVISSPTTGQTIVYNSATQLWYNNTVSLTAGVNGLLPVANGGTGTATPSLVAGTNVTISGTWPNQTINSSGGGSLPSQSGNAGKYLTTDGTNPSWATVSGGGATPITQNLDQVTSNQTIASGSNGFSVGPMTIASGYTVTVASGQRWVII
ncbi:hypothetical protein UFOVP79_15 [uncultured Caudovirales phage]|uniref:Major tropism determinant N-terminal domain-containing protein n=1 Tax=uncultured Caudovirales phage TaxID=2100421 RepID=A0A6J5L097_9CAUD|nr:hypothetical protein UFOVP79_15 [uncultured Caudovirales phage]